MIHARWLRGSSNYHPQSLFQSRQGFREIIDNIIISKFPLRISIDKLDLLGTRPGRGIAIVVVSVGKHDTSESAIMFVVQ